VQKTQAAGRKSAAGSEEGGFFMKKVLAWGLALMMAGSLVGCSQSDSGSTSAAATEGGSEAASVSADAASGDVFTPGTDCSLIRFFRSFRTDSAERYGDGGK